jgi:hypothetical protein
MANTSTVTTSGDIPKVLESFYLGKEGAPGLIERGIESIFPSGKTGTEAYDLIYKDLIDAGLTGAGGIAPLSQFQNIIGEDLLRTQLPGSYGYATEAGQVAGAGLESLLGTQALGVTAPELMQYQMYAPEMFTGEAAQRYMSPYMQNVVDIEQRQALDAARRAQLGANLGSARQGTYGGARQTLLQGERESGLRTQLGDIQARGLQSAYEQAQQQFERDRAAQFGTASRNLDALLGVQSLGAGQSLEAQRANQAAGLDAARIRRESATGLTDLARTMGGIGQAQLGSELDIIKTRGAYGDLQRSVYQDQLDANRRELINRAEYGRTQVGDLSNLMRGIPISDTTQRTTTPPPSNFSQLVGAGLAAVGGYNLMNKP